MFYHCMPRGTVKNEMSSITCDILFTRLRMSRVPPISVYPTITYYGKFIRRRRHKNNLKTYGCIVVMSKYWTFQQL